jgi:hypothetical protein
MESVIKAGGAAALIGLLLGVLSAIPVLGCLFLPLLCVGVFLLPLAAGAGYGYLAPGKESLQVSALGGALAGGFGGFIYGLVSSVVGFVSRAGVTTYLEDSGVVAGARVGVVEVILILCFSAFFGVVLGAIGGALWPVFQGNRT